jgi:hypothetical protein
MFTPAHQMRRMPSNTDSDLSLNPSKKVKFSLVLQDNVVEDIDVDFEPSSKKMCLGYNNDLNIDPVQYTRLYTIMTLYDEINSRIDTVLKIIDDLNIDSNKQTWRKDLEKYQKIKYMIENNMSDRIQIQYI